MILPEYTKPDVKLSAAALAVIWGPAIGLALATCALLCIAVLL